MMRKGGFTILEVLIAVVVMAIGLMAMMAMQVAFINGTTGARDTTTGLMVGESVVEQLRMEGTMWSNITPDLGVATPNLTAGTGSAGQFVNVFDGFPVTAELLPRNNGAKADGVLTLVKETVNAKYCVDVRMQFMENTQDQVIVGQVRVAWPTDNEAPWIGADEANPVACTEDENLNDVIFVNGDLVTPRPEINVVYVPFSIRRHNYAP